MSEMTLAALTDQLQQLHSIQEKRQSTADELEKLRPKYQAKAEALLKEKADVEALQGKSFRAMWYDLLATKAEKLEKEQAEYLQARFEYEELEQAIRRLEAQLAGYDAELAQLPTLLAAKETKQREVLAKLAIQNPAVYENIRSQQQKLEELAHQSIQIREAVLAAEHVMAIAKATEKELRKALDWSMWDGLGGGLLASAYKRDHMRQSQVGLAGLRRAHQHFQREFSDVQPNFSSAANPLDTRFSTADIFFDNFVVDWLVHDHIRESLRSLKTYMQKHARILSHLATSGKELIQASNTAREQLDALLLASEP